MALRFENGSEYLLFVRRKGESAWKTVACLVDNGVDMSTDEITSSSKCSGNAKESMAGETSWTMSANGNAIGDDLKPDEASYKELKDIWRSRETCEWKQAKIGSNDVDYGEGWINSLSKAHNRNEAITFSLGITGTGNLLDTEPTS